MSSPEMRYSVCNAASASLRSCLSAAARSRARSAMSREASARNWLVLFIANSGADAPPLVRSASSAFLDKKFVRNATALLVHALCDAQRGRG
jgi:hypothetical protein